MDAFLAIAGVNSSIAIAGINASPSASRRPQTGVQYSKKKSSTIHAQRIPSRANSASYDMRSALHNAIKDERKYQPSKTSLHHESLEEDSTLVRAIARGVRKSLSKNSSSTIGRAKSSPLLQSSTEMTEKDSLRIDNVTLADYVTTDPDITRGKSLDFLSDRDRSALKLGRLLLSSILDIPEISTVDQVSRFFLDNWLAKNGSSSSVADTLSIDLLCKLENIRSKENIAPDSYHPNINLCIAAIEALDNLIVDFGPANPVLSAIRKALIPCIFVNYVPEDEDDGEQSYLRREGRYNDLNIWLDEPERLKEEVVRLNAFIATMQSEMGILEGQMLDLRKKSDEFDRLDIRGLKKEYEEKLASQVQQFMKYQDDLIVKIGELTTKLKTSEDNNEISRKNYEELLKVNEAERQDLLTNFEQERRQLKESENSLSEKIADLKTELSDLSLQLKLSRDEYKKRIAEGERSERNLKDQFVQIEKLIQNQSLPDNVAICVTNSSKSFEFYSVFKVIVSEYKKVSATLDSVSKDLLLANEAMDAFQAQSAQDREKLVTEYEYKISEKDSALEHKDLVIDEIRSHVSHLHVALTDMTAKAEGLQAILEGKEGEIVQLKIEFAESFATSCAKILALETNLLDTQLSLEEECSVRAALQANLGKLQVELSDVKSAKLEIELKLNSIDSDYQSLKESFENLINEKQVTDRKIVELQNQNVSLNESMLSMKSEFEQEVATFNSRAEESLKRNSVLTKALDAQNIKVESLSEELEAVTKELGNQRAKYDEESLSLKNELSQTANRLTELETIKHEESAKNVALTERIGQLLEKLKEQQSTIDTFAFEAQSRLDAAKAVETQEPLSEKLPTKDFDMPSDSVVSTIVAEDGLRCFVTLVDAVVQTEDNFVEPETTVMLELKPKVVPTVTDGNQISPHLEIALVSDSADNDSSPEIPVNNQNNEDLFQACNHDSKTEIDDIVESSNLHAHEEVHASSDLEAVLEELQNHVLPMHHKIETASTAVGTRSWDDLCYEIKYAARTEFEIQSKMPTFQEMITPLPSRGILMGTSHTGQSVDRMDPIDNAVDSQDSFEIGSISLDSSSINIPKWLNRSTTIDTRSQSRVAILDSRIQHGNYEHGHSDNYRQRRITKVKGRNPLQMIEPFVGFARKNEKRFAKELGVLKVQLMESKALVERLKLGIQTIPAEENSKMHSLIQTLLKDVKENKWLFDTSFVTHPDPKTAIAKADVLSKIDLIEVNNEVVEYVSGSLLDNSITDTEKANLVDISNEIQLLQSDLHEQIEDRGGWKKLLYHDDGTVNRNMDIKHWSAPEQVTILREMLDAVIIEEERMREFIQTERVVHMDTYTDALESSNIKQYDKILSSITNAMRFSISCVGDHLEVLRKSSDHVELMNKQIHFLQEKKPTTPHSVRQRGSLSNTPEGKKTFFGRPVQGKAALFQKIVKERRMQRAKEIASAPLEPVLNDAASLVAGTFMFPNRPETQTDNNEIDVAENLSLELLSLCKMLSDVVIPQDDAGTVGTNSYSDTFDRELGREYSKQLLDSLSMAPNSAIPRIESPIKLSPVALHLPETAPDASKHMSLFNTGSQLDVITDENIDGVDVSPILARPKSSPSASSKVIHQEQELETPLVVPIQIRDFRPKPVNDIDLLMQDFRDRHKRVTNKGASGTSKQIQSK